MRGAAWFSDDDVYRYALLRAIDDDILDGAYRNETVNFIMLNPSTATAEIDDPTIRRCAGFARSWGYGTLMVTNLFAYRATDPRDLKRADDPIGPENDEYIRKVAAGAHLVVAAWGSHGEYRCRDEEVRRIVRDAGKSMQCLSMTAKGQPGHPLYLKRDLLPRRYIRHAVLDVFEAIS